MAIFSIIFLETHKASFKSLAKLKETGTGQKLTFTPMEYSTIVWIEEDKEFQWQGKLYDVSKVESIMNGFIIYCENDRWEEEFISLFSSWKDEKHPNGKTKFFFQPMCGAEQISIAVSPVSILKKYSEYLRAVTEAHTIPASPPPDLFYFLS